MVMEWQEIDIDTLNYELLLLWEPHSMGGFMFVGMYHREDSVWFNNLDQKVQNPTHWMPLPPEPKV